MVSLWKHYEPRLKEYEHGVPPAFPWNRGYTEEKRRYILGEDGYWYDPTAVASSTALLSCVGDLMCEPRMTNAHRYGNHYFFHPLFQYVRNIFQQSDFCVANLETTITDATPYAGDYHCIDDRYHCNAPECYLDAVCYAGFDALVTANNHNCDSGVLGLWDTLRAIDNHGLMRTGSFLPEENTRVLLVKVCGFRLAILSYGNRYNGLDEELWTDKGIDTCLNWFTKEKCLNDVAYAREHGAEFILCYQHWGRDYDEEPNEQQLRILDELKDCGVDYIIGSHTHCLQGHNTATSQNGTQIPMIWSMGNFVTNERRELCKHTGILQLTLSRDNGNIHVEEHFIPCYVFDQFGTGRFCVVPTDTTVNGGYDHPNMASINAYVRSRVGDSLPFLPDRTLYLSDICKEMQISGSLPNRPVTKLCVQSGDVCHGAVYFAFHELTKTDIRRLIAADVTAVVTTNPVEGLPCLTVDDVADAYRAAHTLIRPWGDTSSVILVAGHTGKTITKDLIARTLRQNGRVLAVKDNEHITTAPWQEIHPSHRYCVMELREDHPLGVRDAAALCRPDMVVITASPCDVKALADSLKEGGTLWYNETDAELCNAVSALSNKSIYIRAYGETEVSCPALPFDSLRPCAAAAWSIGKDYGVPEQSIQDAIATYQMQGYTKAILTCDGVHLVLNTNCKTQADAISAKKASPLTERRIAVTTPAFADVFSDWATQLLLLNGKEDLAKTEETLLATLQEGDTLLLCSEREVNASELVRRIFGVTDGFLPDAS